VGIEEKVKVALGMRDMKSNEFRSQLERYEEFRGKMDRAGVVLHKQEFSIPLMERIGNSVFKRVKNA
jgi:hypothetical protein